MTKRTALLFACIFVATVSLGFGVYGLVRAHKSDKAYQSYKTQEAQTKTKVDEMTKRVVELNTKAETAEANAHAAEQKLTAAYQRLDEFGAQGKAAADRLKKAEAQFNDDKTRINNASDSCALCRNTCTERANLSTDDFDVRCAADLCDQFCK